MTHRFVVSEVIVRGLDLDTGRTEQVRISLSREYGYMQSGRLDVMGATVDIAEALPSLIAEAPYLLFEDDRAALEA